MASYRRHHHVIIQDTADLESDRLRRDMFDGNEDATRIHMFSTSGTIDPFTEEVTFHTAHSWLNVSGIVGTVHEKDELLGSAGGRIKMGDTTVLYHYDSVSGAYLANQLREIEIAIPGVSGTYLVTATKIGTVGGRPVFLKVALTLDSNGTF